MRHLEMAKFIVIQSRQVSKELHCFGYSSVKQRAVCMMNVWGYTEILPTIFKSLWETMVNKEVLDPPVTSCM